jgi:hypothetical protein
MFAASILFVSAMYTAAMAQDRRGSHLPPKHGHGNTLADLQRQIDELKQELADQLTTLNQQVTNQGQGISVLTQRVSNLEPRDYTVDCAAGEKVSEVLADAAGRTGSVTIYIKGVCTETVWLERSNTMLVGVTLDAGLQPPSGGSNSLVISGAQGVTVKGLTVTGGKGISIERGGSVFVDSCRIMNSTFHGIWVISGIIELQETTIDGSSGSGIYAWSGSRVRMTGGALQNNSEAGLTLQIGATGRLVGTQVVNNQLGALLGFGASLDLIGVTIKDNAIGGVGVGGNSSLLLDNGTVITNNGGNGIELSDMSVVGWFPGQIAITDNRGWGVFCNDVHQFAPGPPIDISGNDLGQISCAQGQ